MTYTTFEMHPSLNSLSLEAETMTEFLFFFQNMLNPKEFKKKIARLIQNLQQ